MGKYDFMAPFAEMEFQNQFKDTRNPSRDINNLLSRRYSVLLCFPKY